MQAVSMRKQEMVGPASQNQAVDEQHLAGQEPKWLCRACHCGLCVIETLKSLSTPAQQSQSMLMVIRQTVDAHYP